MMTYEGIHIVNIWWLLFATNIDVCNYIDLFDFNCLQALTILDPFFRMSTGDQVTTNRPQQVTASVGEAEERAGAATVCTGLTAEQKALLEAYDAITSNTFYIKKLDKVEERQVRDVVRIIFLDENS